MDRAALVGSLLLHHSPGTNITLFTDRQLWDQWTAMVEKSARAALAAPTPAKAFGADPNLVARGLHWQSPRYRLSVRLTLP